MKPPPENSFKMVLNFHSSFNTFNIFTTAPIEAEDSRLSLKHLLRGQISMRQANYRVAKNKSTIHSRDAEQYKAERDERSSASTWKRFGPFVAEKTAGGGKRRVGGQTCEVACERKKRRKMLLPGLV